VGVADLLLPQLAVDVDVDHGAPVVELLVERAGAEERAGGDDVVEARGLHLGHHVGEAFRLHLEDAVGVAAGDELVDRRIVDGDLVGGEVGAVGVVLAHPLERLVDHGEGLQAQEVELDEPRLLGVVLGELGDEHVALLVLVDRDVLPERLVGDDHAGGVQAGLPVEPLERHGDVEDVAGGHLALGAVGLGPLAHERGLLVELGQARLDLDALPERLHLALHRLGDELGDAVPLGEGEPHDAHHVADHRAGLERAEGGDLADVLLAVLAGDVMDDLVAPVLAEVDVEVGHRHALGVEEALEEEVPADGVEVGDAERPGHDGARARAAPRPHRHLPSLGPVDEVLDDEEVAGEAHLLDDPHLGLEPLPVEVAVVGVLARDLLEAAVEPLAGELGEPLVLGDALRQLEAGQVARPQLHLHVAHLGDAHRVGDGLLVLGEGGEHVLGRGDEEPVGLVVDAARVGEGLVGRDAHEDLVRLRVAAVHVVCIGGGDQRDALALPQLGEPGVHLQLLGHAVRLHLQEEAARLEDVAVLAGGGPGAVHVALVGEARDLAAQAGGETHQALRMLPEQALVDAGVVVEPLRVGHGREVAKVGPPLGVLREQDQVAAHPLASVRPALGAGHVGLHAQDGFHPGRLGRPVEVDRAEEVAVVGDRHGAHAPLFHRPRQIAHADGAVEEGVEGVQVKVDEIGQGVEPPGRR